MPPGEGYPAHKTALDSVERSRSGGRLKFRGEELFEKGSRVHSPRIWPGVPQREERQPVPPRSHPSKFKVDAGTCRLLPRGGDMFPRMAQVESAPWPHFGFSRGSDWQGPAGRPLPQGMCWQAPRTGPRSAPSRTGLLLRNSDARGSPAVRAATDPNPTEVVPRTPHPTQVMDRRCDERGGRGGPSKKRARRPVSLTITHPLGRRAQGPSPQESGLPAPGGPEGRPPPNPTPGTLTLGRLDFSSSAGNRPIP